MNSDSNSLVEQRSPSNYFESYIYKNTQNSAEA